VIRQFWARHPWLTDSLIAAAYSVPALIGAIVMTLYLVNHVGGFAFIGLAAALASIVAVLLRRRAPISALALAAIAMLVSMGGFSFLAVGTGAVLYAVAVYHSNRAAWYGLAGSLAALGLGALLQWPSPGQPTITDGQVPITAGLYFLACVLIGINIGNRKRYLAALIDRAAQLVRERDQQAQLAAAAERARIAREMHDIVSHSLTVMVTLAEGSAAQVKAAPDDAGDAMRQVAETGRGALTDMRRMLGVLNESDGDGAAELEPQPGADELTQLVARFRETSLPIVLQVTGVPPADPGIQLTVFRVVQESLTNVLRHAPGSTSVTTSIRYSPETISVDVVDSGSEATTPATTGAGRGLLGMRERVGLYDGTLESGPRPGGGWRVSARIPMSDSGGD
jgi:signal transduction histidine kinase